MLGISHFWLVVLTLSIWSISDSDGGRGHARHVHIPSHCDVDMERLVHIEGELVDFCSLVIRNEEIVHQEDRAFNFSDVKIFLEDAMSHSETILEAENRIAENPLALFQLRRSLNSKWLSILNRVGESQLIRKHINLASLLADYRNFLENHLQVERSCLEVMTLSKLYGFHVNALAHGWFGDSQSEPLSVDDVIYFAEKANEYADHQTALDWLLLLRQRPYLDVGASLPLSHLSLIGSTHLKLHNYATARETFEDILSRDPGNRAAMSNLKLLEQRRRKTSGGRDARNRVKDSVTGYAKLCQEHDVMSSRKESYLTCYEKIIPISNETLKIEVLHKEPQLVMIHDVISGEQREMLLERSTQKLWEIINGRYGAAHAKTAGAKVYFDNRRWWMERYISRFRNVTYQSPSDWLADDSVLSWLEVSRISPGLTGEKWLSDYTLMDLPMPKTRGSEAEHIGHYLIFLKAAINGGFLLFPALNIRVTPFEGAALFWQFRAPGGPIHAELEHVLQCPAAVGAQWVAMATVEHRGKINRIEF